MNYEDGGFQSRIPDNALMLIYQLGRDKEIDPLSSIESEEYFCRLLSEYSGSEERLAEYLRECIQRDFRVMKHPPRWIQGSEWQFCNGKPMAFAGQLDDEDRGDSFYIFWDMESGEIKTIRQLD